MYAFLEAADDFESDHTSAQNESLYFGKKNIKKNEDAELIFRQSLAG